MRILLFLAMLALPGFHHASGETLNRVVAIVNDDLVTLYELNKKIKELTGRTPVELRSQNEDQYYEVRGKILELLIDDKIKQAKVLEMGIEVSQKKIDDARYKDHRGWRLFTKDEINQIKKLNETIKPNR